MFRFKNVFKKINQTKRDIEGRFAPLSMSRSWILDNIIQKLISPDRWLCKFEFHASMQNLSL